MAWTRTACIALKDYFSQVKSFQEQIPFVEAIRFVEADHLTTYCFYQRYYALDHRILY